MPFSDRTIAGVALRFLRRVGRPGYFRTPIRALSFSLFDLIRLFELDWSFQTT